MLEVLSAQDLSSLRVDHLALLVHDIVVLEKMFTDFKIVSLDFPLGILDGLRHETMLNRLVLFNAQAIHDVRNPLGPKNPKKVILQSQIKS
jgi:hypothetical protein